MTFANELDRPSVDVDFIGKTVELLKLFLGKFLLPLPNTRYGIFRRLGLLVKITAIPTFWSTWRRKVKEGKIKNNIIRIVLRTRMHLDVIK